MNTRNNDNPSWLMVIAYFCGIFAFSGCTGETVSAIPSSFCDSFETGKERNENISAMTPAALENHDDAGKEPPHPTFWSRFTQKSADSEDKDYDNVTRVRIRVNNDGTFTSRETTPAGKIYRERDGLRIRDPELEDIPATIPALEMPAPPPLDRVPSFIEVNVASQNNETDNDRSEEKEAVPAQVSVEYRYRVRPGDALNISIPYEPGTERSVPVMPDGYIRYLFDIEVEAAGKTYAQIHDDLVKKLGKYYKNPRVTVIGESFKGNSVFVMGPVSNPGSHVIHKGTKLLDVLAKSGLLSLLPQLDSLTDGEKQPEIVDLEGAYVARGDRILEVDFKKLLLGKDMSYNIRLMPEDFIFIPSAFGSQNKVYICGKVRFPKVFYFNGSATFMEAILNAGGTDTDNSEGAMQGDTADARRCILIRKSENQPRIIDWPSIQRGKGEDFALKSGDIIYVPERKLSHVSRVTSKVIRDLVDPLKAVLELDDTAKSYYRRDWQLPSRGKARTR